MNRRQFLLALAAPTPKPNVLFIAVDDLRPELGCYGAAHVHSPHLDALARSATLFSRAYCQQALCNPSRASMLTGLRPDSLQVWNLQTDFRSTTPHAITLPQLFKANGYHTLNSGKLFHNIFPDPPSWSEPDLRLPNYPFDPDAVYRGQAETNQLEARKQQILAAGNQARYIDQYGQWYLKNNATEAPDVPDNAYFDGAQTDAAIARLPQLQAAHKPFFLSIGYYRPHLPFNAPKKYWDLYDRSKIPLAPNPVLPQNAPPMAENRNRELRGYQDFKAAPTPDQGTVSESQARLLRHGYLASVSYIDAQIGRLLAELDRLKLASNTIVVLWGDHGWKLGEHNAWGKMTNYEIDTRVPLLIRAPGVSPGVCPGLVESVDIYPTLCDLAGLTPPPNLEGTTLTPLLRRPSTPGKRAIFTQYLRDGLWVAPDGVTYMGRAIRTERYRYVEWSTFPANQLTATELYDLTADPAENKNIAATSPNLCRQLAARLKSGWRAEHRPL